MATTDPHARLMRRIGAVAWPAFMTAAVLEMLVFAMVDPQALHGFGGAPLDWSSQAVYSAAFFVFWAAVACAGTVSTLLMAD